jgi:DDE superfamily endonuclease
LPRVLLRYGDSGEHLSGSRVSTQAGFAVLEKETLGATERDEEKRGAFRERLRGVDPKRLLFVDESSTNVAIVPRYARAPKGQRAYAKAPRNWGKNVTLISSITLSGMGPSMSIEGSSDTESFLGST